MFRHENPCSCPPDRHCTGIDSTPQPGDDPHRHRLYGLDSTAFEKKLNAGIEKHGGYYQLADAIRSDPLYAKWLAQVDGNARHLRLGGQRFVDDHALNVWAFYREADINYAISAWHQYS